MKNILNKIPSFIWVFLFPLGLVAFIGGIGLLFYLLANVEGVASILMIIALLASIRFLSGDIFEESGASAKYSTYSGFWIGGAICFFALMGVAIDQPGNYFYNKPLEILFCPQDTSLSRYVKVTNPLPGRTDMTQNFDCINANGELEHRIGVPQIIAVRFTEYVIIAYIFIGIVKVYRFVKLRLV